MNKIIKLFMLLFFIQGIFYSLYVTPANTGSSPDDFGHISYIMYFASNKSIPMFNKDRMESHIDVMLKMKGNFSVQANMMLENKEYSFDTSKHNCIAQHPPLFYIAMLLPHYIATKLTDNFYNYIYILRLLPILFGVILIYALGNILKDLKIHKTAQICILSLVAFSPPLIFYFSTVGNDGLTILLFTLVWMFYIKFIKENKIKYFFLYVLFMALGLMTKYTGILAVITTVPLVIHFLIKKYGYKKAFQFLTVGALVGIVIIAPYFIRNFIEFGNGFPTVLSTSKLYTIKYHRSISDFIIEYKYFDTLLRHILLLIGQFGLISATNFIYLIVMSIMLLFILYGNKNFISKQYSILILLLGFILCAFIELNVFNTYIVIVYFLMLYLYITDTIKYKDLYVGIPVVLTIFFVIIIFFITHYNMFLARGFLKGMHGRYFYPMLFPALHVLSYAIIKENERKDIFRMLPLPLILLLIIAEIHVITLVSQWWY